jgi:hypothetical protein
VFDAPFTNEGLASRFDLLACFRADHVVAVGGGFLVQALGRVREQSLAFLQCAATAGKLR